MTFPSQAILNLLPTENARACTQVAITLPSIPSTPIPCNRVCIAAKSQTRLLPASCPHRGPAHIDTLVTAVRVIRHVVGSIVVRDAFRVHHAMPPVAELELALRLGKVPAVRPPRRGEDARELGAGPLISAAEPLGAVRCVLVRGRGLGASRAAEDLGQRRREVDADGRQADDDDGNVDLEGRPDQGVGVVPGRVDGAGEQHNVAQADAAREQDEEAQAEHDDNVQLVAPARVQRHGQRQGQQQQADVLENRDRGRRVGQRVDVETLVAPECPLPSFPVVIERYALKYL